MFGSWAVEYRRRLEVFQTLANPISTPATFLISIHQPSSPLLSLLYRIGPIPVPSLLTHIDHVAGPRLAIELPVPASILKSFTPSNITAPRYLPLAVATSPPITTPSFPYPLKSLTTSSFSPSALTLSKFIIKTKLSLYMV